jgi:hypothetical protein
MSDNTKATLAAIAFFGALPLLYLAPVILNAVTDLAIH